MPKMKDMLLAFCALQRHHLWLHSGFATAFTRVHMQPTRITSHAFDRHCAREVSEFEYLQCPKYESLAAFDENLRKELSAVPRRSFLDSALTAATFLSIAPLKTHAAVISLQTPSVGTLKSLTPEEAEQRFRAGRKSVEYLLNNYDEICEGGGDNVRRYLGTVGTTSGLFGIGKALKVLGDRAEDIVECEFLAKFEFFFYINWMLRHIISNKSYSFPFLYTDHYTY